MWYTILTAVLAGYLLGNLNGSVNISMLVADDDVRKHGSGNAGLTNFFRSYGSWSTLLVLLIDMGKTALACLVGGLILEPHGYGAEGAAVTGAWSSTKMTISGIEAAKTFKFQNANTSNKQLRIKSIKVTYEPVADAVDTAIPPTFTNSGNFVGSTMVEIENNDDKATVYVSVDGGNYVAYEKFEIEKTTTVSAYTLFSVL